MKKDFKCTNIADAYDPYWIGSVSNQRLETTNCEKAVSPSQFVDLKYHCPKGKHKI